MKKDSGGFAIKNQGGSYREERDARNSKRQKRQQVVMAMIGIVVLATMLASTVMTAFQ